VPSMAPEPATTKPRRVRTTMAFPCGHREAERSVERRIHTTPGGIWIRCRRCNLIALARPARAVAAAQA
jgi:hypothetical protein